MYAWGDYSKNYEIGYQTSKKFWKKMTSAEAHNWEGKNSHKRWFSSTKNIALSKIKPLGKRLKSNQNMEYVLNVMHASLYIDFVMACPVANQWIIQLKTCKSKPWHTKNGTSVYDRESPHNSAIFANTLAICRLDNLYSTDSRAK